MTLTTLWFMKQDFSYLTKCCIQGTTNLADHLGRLQLTQNKLSHRLFVMGLLHRTNKLTVLTVMALP